MITRIKIDGFKNLHQTEVHFGPFTCIAGANAVGKSNLFDAICFLSYLADMPLLEAARSVRSEVSRQGDVSSLFRHHATAGPRLMTFEVDMIVPETGHDDLGQPATASTTTLQYRLEIGLQPDPLEVDGQLEILKEELLPVKIGDAKKTVLFDASTNWKKSVVRGRRIAPLISSETTDEVSIIRLHQDGKQGNLLRRKARHLPRTVLSTVDAVQYPTASLARREMRSWHLLQLEPSSLRQSDSFDDFRQQQVHMDEHGRFLPATFLPPLPISRSYDAHVLDDLSADAGVDEGADAAAGQLKLLLPDRRVDLDEQHALAKGYLAGMQRDGAAHDSLPVGDDLLYVGLVAEAVLVQKGLDGLAETDVGRVFHAVPASSVSPAGCTCPCITSKKRSARGAPVAKMARSRCAEVSVMNTCP